jgi:hypothetical protein
VEQVLWQLFNLAAGHPPPPPFVFDIRLLIFNEKQNYLQADPKNSRRLRRQFFRRHSNRRLRSV